MGPGAAEQAEPALPALPQPFLGAGSAVLPPPCPKWGGGHPKLSLQPHPGAPRGARHLPPYLNFPSCVPGSTLKCLQPPITQPGAPQSFGHPPCFPPGVQICSPGCCGTPGVPRVSPAARSAQLWPGAVGGTRRALLASCASPGPAARCQLLWVCTGSPQTLNRHPKRVLSPHPKCCGPCPSWIPKCPGFGHCGPSSIPDPFPSLLFNPIPHSGIKLGKKMGIFTLCGSPSPPSSHGRAPKPNPKLWTSQRSPAPKKNKKLFGHGLASSPLRRWAGAAPKTLLHRPQQHQGHFAPCEPAWTAPACSAEGSTTQEFSPDSFPGPFLGANPRFSAKRLTGDSHVGEASSLPNCFTKALCETAASPPGSGNG